MSRNHPRLVGPVQVQPGPAGPHRTGWVEYIPIGELHIDTSYQRDVDYSFVNTMARDFDYTQLELQAWSVGRRMSGKGEEHTDYIIDGQHRWLALQTREDGTYVVACHVRISEGADWEANEYLRINFARKQPTAAGRFKAAVQAGRKFGWDNDAEVAALLKELGIDTPATTRATFHRQPGGSAGVPVLLAIGKVCRLHMLHPDLTRIALTTQRDTWGESNGKAYDGILFDALADFWAAHEDDRNADGVVVCTIESLVRVLRTTTPDALHDAGEQMRGTRTMPLRACMARTIAEMFNRGKRMDARVRELAPLNYISIRASRQATVLAARKTPEERREIALRGAASMTAGERSARTQRGIESMSAEERSERSRKAAATKTPEQRAAAGYATAAAMTAAQRAERSRTGGLSPTRRNA